MSLLIDGAMPDAASLATILASLQAQITAITNAGVTGSGAANQVAIFSSASVVGSNSSLTYSASTLNAPNVSVDPTGTGIVNASAYKVGGTAGLASFSGAITNLTVVNGIVTAAS